MAGSEQTQDNTSSQETTPWAPTVRPLQSTIRQSNRLYRERLGQEYFPGQTYAGFDPLQTQAQNMGIERATNGSPLVQGAQGMIGDTLGGNFLSAGNPYFQNMIHGVTSAVMPGINATFSRAGRTGSDAHGYGLAQGMTDAFGRLAFDNYSQERGNQMQAAGMAPNLAREDYFDIGMLGEIGSERQRMAQRGIDEERARYQFDQDRRANALRERQAILFPAAGLGGTSTGTSTSTMTTTPDPLQQALGVGLMGASMFAGGGPFTGFF